MLPKPGAKGIDIKGDGQYKIRYYPPLAYILGIKVNEWWLSTPYTCDLNTETYNLFLYTDVVQYQAVGDGHSPLLGIVSVKSDFGDVESLRYNTVHYVPVSKNYIKTIHIEIKTGTDRYVNFVFGKTSL